MKWRAPETVDFSTKKQQFSLWDQANPGFPVGAFESYLWLWWCFGVNWRGPETVDFSTKKQHFALRDQANPGFPKGEAF